MSHNNLVNYYTMIFSMAQHHKYSISELENLIPFERDTYYELLMNYLRDREEKMRQQDG